MKNRLTFLLSGLILISQLSWACPGDHKGHHPCFGGVFQYSNINALLAGYFDGDMSLQRLSRKGNFGLGTLNGLDGELIAVDGTFYQIKADGKAFVLPNNAKTPFAVVTEFAAEQTIKLPENLSYEELQAFLSKQIHKNNHIQAIRIDGRFSTLKVRSIPQQKPPYRTLAEINKTDMVIFNHTDVEGTLVGFRFPPYLNTLNVSGYHFHFIDKERKFGGHVLDLTSTSGQIGLKNTSRFKMVLPQDDQFNQLDLSKDFSQDLQAVEKGHQ